LRLSVTFILFSTLLGTIASWRAASLFLKGRE
jgi:hypothetical protein